MSKRCPESRFVGTARLHGWKFIINQCGYATIVQSENDHVWALVYDLTANDEAALDINERVPFSYVKKYLEVTLWDAGVVDDVGMSVPPGCPGNSVGRTVSSLVYVDERRTEEGPPKEEYIYRVGMGIEDAVTNGVPVEYFERYVRSFIPKKPREELEKIAQPRVVSRPDAS
jgi:gamma-glutamylcyclotransferase